MTQKEAFQKIRSYIEKKASYDYTYSKFNFYNILNGGKGVCQAYAQLVQVMCKSVGIECYACPGTANNGSSVGSHMWNRVKLDGTWYYTDLTWDDSCSIDYSLSTTLWSDHYADGEYTFSEAISRGYYWIPDGGATVTVRVQ
jgi:transglutaminase/protease-like cytokinesis protein 3